ncbi:hypothetical protein GCM10023200_01070 [Actinomycetospora chlora]|uniref:Uncharacterized protein n=2 Tax=Actinomycetospora chlora TaxID=663608 RepID=A0ABP9A270_9PSEU
MRVTRPPRRARGSGVWLAVMSSDPDTTPEPDPTPVARPDADPEDVEPAFDIDLEPEDQGLAGTGEEPTG